MNATGLRILLTADAVGGVWQYSVELASALAAAGAEIILAVLGPLPAAEQRREVLALPGVKLFETGLPLDWLCDGPAPAAAAGRAIARIAGEERVDLVQLSSPALAAGTAFPVPVVVVAHGCVATWWEAARSEPLAPEYRWHRKAMADGLAAADRVVAPSAAYARIIARHYALPCAPLVVHNSRTMPRATATAPLHSSALTVGRLWDPVKNAALLDGVAARLAIPFDAAGAARGPHGEAVSLDHLHLLGELATQALAVRLAERPVYVSAATFEPFGLAVLEAAAAGCALVLSDIATFRELWDGVAIFVPATEATAYADAIEAVVGDMALRRRMGDEARERAAQYTPAKTAGEMLNVYASALRDRAPRKRAAA